MIQRVKLQDTQSLAGALRVVDGYIQHEIELLNHPTPAMCNLLLLKAIVLQHDQLIGMLGAVLDRLAPAPAAAPAPFEAVEDAVPTVKGKVKK